MRIKLDKHFFFQKTLGKCKSTTINKYKNILICQNSHPDLNNENWDWQLFFTSSAGQNLRKIWGWIVTSKKNI